MEEDARPATQADLPEVSELCRAALAELGGQDRGGALYAAREARAEPVENSLGAALGDPTRHVVVGTVDGTVLGFATAHLEWLRNDVLLGVVEEIFVHGDARGVGVGAAMMAVLMDWFRAHECDGVDALALPGMRASKNFFEQAGFSARLIVMHHRMARGDP